MAILHSLLWKGFFVDFMSLAGDRIGGMVHGKFDKQSKTLGRHQMSSQTKVWEEVQVNSPLKSRTLGAVWEADLAPQSGEKGGGHSSS